MTTEEKSVAVETPVAEIDKKKKSKAKAISLGEFLGDSWADEEDDLPTAPAAVENEEFTTVSYKKRDDKDSRYERKPDLGRNRELNRSSSFRDDSFKKFSGDREFRNRDGDKEFRGREGDREFGSRPFRDRPARPPRNIEFPTEPPFTAYVGGLPYAATEEDLNELFKPIGVSKVRIVREKFTRESKGYGYAEFDTADNLKEALNLNGTDFQGRTLKVDLAEPAPVREPRESFESRPARPFEPRKAMIPSSGAADRETSWRKPKPKN